MENVRLLLQIDNARLATDDFKHKLEVEQAACDTVQKDTQGLRKIIDDTNFLRLKLEGDLESLGEELAHLRKSHEEEVEALTALVANSDVTVQVDNPQKHDLSETIADIRNQYEQVAEQNRADTQDWYRTKVDALENTLKNTEDHYLSDLANLNQVIANLQEDLAACRADLETQSRDYETLLDLKTKLENEIEHYRVLIEGVIDRGDVLSSGKAEIRSQIIKKVVVITHKIVNEQDVTQRSEEIIQ
ncbi:hypothetical protein E2320_020468 [Naja naja]|nr:hypothetical protein E2320_020468 [Naja naja]